MQVSKLVITIAPEVNIGNYFISLILLREATVTI